MWKGRKEKHIFHFLTTFSAAFLTDNELIVERHVCLNGRDILPKMLLEMISSAESEPLKAICMICNFHWFWYLVAKDLVSSKYLIKSAMNDPHRIDEKKKKAFNG